MYLDVPALTIGSVLSFTGEITLAPVDQTPADNVSTIQRTVVNSYDPNSKEVLPAGDVTPAQVNAGLELDYTIRFQNTGNDTAYFVRLIDTLSSNLDLGTFQWVGESHTAHWDINQNRVLIVDFDNINLVDSIANEPGSHGFFRYKVAALTTLGLGDRIENTANIYFDFNSPIVTNTVLTLVADPLSVYSPQAESQLIVYPVPANDQLFFKWKSESHREAKVKIIDTYGKTCASFDLNTTGATVNVSDLAEGMYFFQVTEQGKLLEAGKFLLRR